MEVNQVPFCNLCAPRELDSISFVRQKRKIQDLPPQNTQLAEFKQLFFLNELVYLFGVLVTQRHKDCFVVLRRWLHRV